MTFQDELDKFVKENIKIVSFIVFIISMMFWRLAFTETILFVIGFIVYTTTLNWRKPKLHEVCEDKTNEV